MSFTVAQYISARSSYDPNTADNQTLISMAELEIGSNYSTDLRSKAVSLLVMHWLSLPKDNSGNNSLTGTIKSEKEGDLARSYGYHGKVSLTDAYLSQTGYGLELINLNRSSFVLPMNRNAYQ